MDKNNLQRSHFNKLAKTYNYHYSDELTKKYRHEIFLKKLLKDQDLNFKKILDIGCGTGELSTYLYEIYPDAEILGADISDKNIKIYNNKFKNKKKGGGGYRLNVVEDIILKKKFDYIIACGLLHHVYKDLEKVFINISKMLNDNGKFIFIDPNSDYILEPLRKIWYRLDKYFDSVNESALSYNNLLTINRKLKTGLIESKVFFFGGPGFFLINNSMIFRLNKKIKASLFVLLLNLDKLFSFLPKYFLASFAAVWEKKYYK
jgi:2-polyprenyl-3-methyl-5-hydroxy-6-metoxy-1,4-benzoquinol methylase